MHTFILLMVAAAGNWELAAETDGIKVFTRAKEGTAVREVKAIGEIDASPERVFRVLADFEHYTEFMPYTRESKVVAREGKSTYFYSYIAPPIVANRDYTIKMTDESVADIFKVSWVPANERGPAPRSGTVRLGINSGSWTLEPGDAGKTVATYYLYTDPAGAIPNWMVNKANRDTVPDVMKAVRKRVKDRRYELAQAP